MKKTSQTHFSKKLLLGLFTISFLVFVVIRWDTSSVVRKTIDKAATEAGYQLNYASLSLNGLTLQLQDVTLENPRIQPIHLDSIQISPAYAKLFSATLGADIEAVWLGNPMSAVVSQEGELLHLSNINAMIDISRVKNLQIPAQLSGVIQAKGDFSVSQANGLPHSGNLKLNWNKAMAGLATPEFNLGDYQFNLNSVDDSTQPWQWTVSGGQGVALEGTGTLLPNKPDPKQWLVNGLLDAKIDNSNPALSMMMQSFVGNSQAKLKISGSLGLPRMDIVR